MSIAKKYKALALNTCVKMISNVFLVDECFFVELNVNQNKTYANKNMHEIPKQLKWKQKKEAIYHKQIKWEVSDANNEIGCMFACE